MIETLEKLKETARFGDKHPLQYLDVYQRNPDPNTTWIVFIHGGAWRDPTKTTAVGIPLFTHLLAVLPLGSVNFASLSYRLSPHPDYPDESPPNTAKHPDHLDDIVDGIAWLVEKKNMRRYVLVGHSAGATLAMQYVKLKMENWREAERERKERQMLGEVTGNEGRTHSSSSSIGSSGGYPIVNNSNSGVEDGTKAKENAPQKQQQNNRQNSIHAQELHRSLLCVIGVEGIYDLPSLVEEGGPVYRAFIEGAFGPADETPKNWENASPSVMGVDGYKGMVVLAHSDEDELVTWRQVEEMKKSVEKSKGVGGSCRVMKVKGTHDEVLEEGRLAKVVEGLVREAAKLGK